VASEWLGTDDTPSSGAWSPTNTAGTDLMLQTASVYDEGGVGDGNLTSSAQTVEHTASPAITRTTTSRCYTQLNRLALGKSAKLVMLGGGVERARRSSTSKE
jgi:hypothetical protein